MQHKVLYRAKAKFRQKQPKMSIKDKDEDYALLFKRIEKVEQKGISKQVTQVYQNNQTQAL